MMNKLNILFWNCNGITNRIQELYAFTKINNIHIILLGETRINTSTPLKLPYYHTYRQDRPINPGKPPAGGTAILIRSNIIHQQENIQTSIDSTTITIKMGNDPIRISSFYKSPRTLITNNDLDILTNHGGFFLIAGDLNAKHTTWHCRTTNTACRIIHRHMVTSNNYIISAPDSPTHFHYNNTQTRSTRHRLNKSPPI